LRSPRRQPQASTTARLHRDGSRRRGQLGDWRLNAAGDGTLLDNTVVIYGSPMGDSNLHNHKRVWFFIAGRAGGGDPGGLHLKAPGGTPLANVMLSLLHALGSNEISSFGDSTARFDLSDPTPAPGR
jgi:hypothetical protein